MLPYNAKLEQPKQAVAVFFPPKDKSAALSTDDWYTGHITKVLKGPSSWCLFAGQTQEEKANLAPAKYNERWVFINEVPDYVDEEEEGSDEEGSEEEGSDEEDSDEEDSDEEDSDKMED